MFRKALSQQRWFAALFLLAALLSSCDLRLNPSSLPVDVVDLPFGQTQVSFSEIVYDSRLDRVIVPAAETGALALVDPATQNARLIEGFSGRGSETGSVSKIGAVSAAVARGMIFALDRAARKINIINPSTGSIVGSAQTEDEPQFIRFISATNEIWVTEPVLQQIEVYKVIGNDPPSLEKSDPIPVPDGPEGLILDRTRGLAFTNQPNAGTTAVIQVITHNIIFEWGNGCSRARGMAIDENEGFLFIACNEGKVVMVDINQNGAQITSQNYGGDINFVAYDPQKKHLYLPSGASAIVAVYAIVETSKIPTPTTPPRPTATEIGDVAPTLPPPSKYTLVRLGTADTALKASCITIDDLGNIWVCDPSKGRLFLIRDSFPPGG